jgi:anti-anti-sigma factor
LPPIQGGAPLDDAPAPVPVPVKPTPTTTAPAPSSIPIATGQSGISLHIQAGDSAGRTVIVSSPRFVIGREAHCQLRLGSAQVSKQHAVLEQRAGRLFLRDLGSTNGTMLNGQSIRHHEREIHDGDRIHIGPVIAVLTIGPTPSQQSLNDALLPEPVPVDTWGTAAPQPDAAPSTEELPQFDELDPERRIKHEVLEGVLVVTPQFSELDDEGALEALRSKLHALLEEPHPRRVVVNLEFINHLSRQAIALLLSHHVRLDWAGGALRICQAHARIIALLDQVRLTMLVDCFPTLDEAVLAAWTCDPKDSLVKRY